MGIGLRKQDVNKKQTTTLREKFNEKREELRKEMLKEMGTDFTESIKESIKQDEGLRNLVLSMILAENTRLSKYPALTQIFLEVMLFRLESKKNKIGLLKATVNQINIGINITEEIFHEAGLDDYLIQ